MPNSFRGADSGAQPPNYRDVLEARRQLKSHLPRTPLYDYPCIERRTGLVVSIKHENHLPTGSFHLRGARYLVSRLSTADRASGLVTASTGNFGRALAFAGAQSGVPISVVLPDACLDAHGPALTSLKVQFSTGGSTLKEATTQASNQARQSQLRWILASEEPDLIAGAATLTLEIFEEIPDLDVLYIPVGTGAAAAGACLVAQQLRPEAKIVGVQSEDASEGLYQPQQPETSSWPLPDGSTHHSVSLPAKILREQLSEFVVVSAREVHDAMHLYLDATRNLAEPCGALALAAACRQRDELTDKKVAIILSGGNPTLDQVRSLLPAR